MQAVEQSDPNRNENNKANLGGTSQKREPILALEGRPFYFGTAAVAVLFFFMGMTRVSGFTFILAVAVALFFRNPRRHTPTGKNLLISPADGTLLCAGEVTSMCPGEVESSSKIPGQKSKRITIFLSVLDVHVNRYPCDGTITTTTYNPGKFLAAFNDKASIDNEQQATLISNAKNEKVLVIQIAGLIARRIVCYAKEQQSADCGKLMGLIRFGSRVDLWIPAHWQITVKPGQRMRGGETILAIME